MQFIKSIATVALVLASSVLADNPGDWCSRDVNLDGTICNDARTQIMYCDGYKSQWVATYPCPGTCHQNPPGGYPPISKATC